MAHAVNQGSPVTHVLPGVTMPGYSVPLPGTGSSLVDNLELMRGRKTTPILVASPGRRWVLRNRRGPHLEGRLEPQASSPFRTPTAGSLQSWDRRVRSRLV